MKNQQNQIELVTRPGDGRVGSYYGQLPGQSSSSGAPGGGTSRLSKLLRSGDPGTMGCFVCFMYCSCILGEGKLYFETVACSLPKKSDREVIYHSQNLENTIFPKSHSVRRGIYLKERENSLKTPNISLLASSQIENKKVRIPSSNDNLCQGRKGVMVVAMGARAEAAGAGGRLGPNERPQVSPSRAAFMPDSPGTGRPKKEASPWNSGNLSRSSVSQVRYSFLLKNKLLS